MALPSTGQLSFSQIYAEVYGSHSTQQCSMFAMATSAGKSTTNIGVDDWYNYSAGSTIVYDYSNSVVYYSNTSGDKDAYNPLDFTGRQSGDIITLNIEVNFTEAGKGGAGTLYYSKNSTSTWNSLGSYSAPTVTGVNITGVDYNDVIRIRIDVISIIAGACTLSANLLGGSFTSGSGTITASGSTTWSLTADQII